MIEKFEVPKLPYAYNALEPYMDEETMKIHHQKHHQAYCDKFNLALEAEKISERDLKKIFSKVSKYSTAIRNQGGGYWNHIFFFEGLAKAGDEPQGRILELIKRDFGSYENFKKEFTEKALGLFGSGWVWLGITREGELVIYTTHNQDNAFMDLVHVESEKPLLSLDVWEHAYYLKYQNKRAEFVENFFKVINWKKLNSRLEE